MFALTRYRSRSRRHSTNMDYRRDLEVKASAVVTVAEVVLVAVVFDGDGGVGTCLQS